jgi:hypothetical protein
MWKYTEPFSVYKAAGFLSRFLEFLLQMLQTKETNEDDWVEGSVNTKTIMLDFSKQTTSGPTRLWGQLNTVWWLSGTLAQMTSLTNTQTFTRGWWNGQTRSLGSTDLQRPGSEVDAGTGNALRLEPYKDICAKAVIHIVPETKHRRNCSALDNPGYHLCHLRPLLV